MQLSATHTPRPQLRLGQAKALFVDDPTVVVKQAATDGVPCPADYRITDSSRRVVNSILSTVRSHREWAGVRVAQRPLWTSPVSELR
jgi:hypothetical protein